MTTKANNYAAQRGTSPKAEPLDLEMWRGWILRCVVEGCPNESADGSVYCEPCRARRAGL